MKKQSITILWPEHNPLEVEEFIYSISFCQAKSKELCSGTGLKIDWTSYKMTSSMAEIISGVESDFLLLISDPELILSAQAVLAMVQSIVSGTTAIGPVYNLTDFPNQQANLPAPYLNTTGFDELVRYNYEHENKKNKTTDQLDPSCILYPAEFLKSLTNDQFSVSPIDFSKHPYPKEICNRALVHRFGNYYDGERPDLVALIPERVKSILDVGTAMGGYGRGLKKERPEIILSGVETNSLMAQNAEKYYDRIHIGKVEDILFDEQFDLINCGDVIEHLYDPWQTLDQLFNLIKPGGYLLLSVPNVGHWSIALDLLKGKFDYIPVGIQCITHIRWFTEQSIKTALKNSGFEIDIFHRQQHAPTPDGENFIRKMMETGFGNEQSLLANEFIIRAVKK